MNNHADTNLPDISGTIRPTEVWHATASAGDPGPVEFLCERYLNEDDRQRADQFRRPTSRNQHVVGRGMTRRLLGGQNVDPEAWRYDDEPGGKPRLKIDSKHHHAMTFNVSHTEGLVLCGVCGRSQLLGVDVERRDRRVDVRMADRYFSSPEIDYVQSRDTDAAKLEAFLRIWTLKESFIKAIGTGLRTPLADFAFDSIGSRSPTIRFLDPALAAKNEASEGQWRFESFEPRKGFIAAVATWSDQANRADPTQIRLRNFDDFAD